MKKQIKVITSICFVFFLVSIIALPTDTHAVTLKQYEDQVAKYTAELKEKEAKLAKNDAEIAEVKKKITEIEGKITEAEAEMTKLEAEIEKSNKEIEDKKEQSKKLMKYIQVVDSENTCMEYIFGAKSITDMIARMTTVEQLTEYNDNLIKDLERLIKENNQKKSDLDAKKSELKQLNSDLQGQKDRIEADSASVRVTMPSTKNQIKMYQDQVNYWKNKGCKSNDVLGLDCGVPKKISGGNSYNGAGASGFRFPVPGGYVTQGYVGYPGHLGVDIGKGYGAPIYAVAVGEVVAKYYDNAGALVIKIVHNYNGRLVFSTYAHMQSFAVNKGQAVDTNTIIGYMGSTGNSTGPHLHLEMSNDYDWTYNLTGSNCYNRYIKNYIVKPWTYIPGA